MIRPKPSQPVVNWPRKFDLFAVQICVEAAFDFLSGHKARATRWMQRCGLEWFFRLAQVPRRLGRWYLVNNTLFLGKLAAKLVRHAPSV